jgi:hypothetical protein
VEKGIKRTFLQEFLEKHMDALLQIVIPYLEEIEGLEVTQPVYEWDGEEYPQGPKIVSWDSISLSFDERTKSLEKFLPSGYLGEDWIWLKVSDEVLDDYEGWANNEGEEIKKLEDFLRLLLNDLEKWCVVFLLQYDQIDSIYQLNVEECLDKLKSNFSINTSKEGFVIYK